MFLTLKYAVSHTLESTLMTLKYVLKEPGGWLANDNLSQLWPHTVRPTGEEPCGRSHLNCTDSRRT